ncbi:medium-chain acyl-CoA ligase ACSF2, mitochondrial-like [Planococcus citri]|uniref:medium-chain acyl-CoA ligase ACSF2, mitochondrial-like n=1 Tax=Planococcus citri TaxID=170843 RepID=UPI0031F74770
MHEKIENVTNGNNAPTTIEQTEKRYYESEEKLLQDAEIRRNLSYWKNAGTETLKNVTINELFIQCVEKYGDRQAICVHRGSRLTYKQVLPQVDEFAAGLLAIGLKKGDMVGIWAQNSLEWYITSLAIMKAGLVTVNLNPLYEGPEIKSALIQSHVKALIIGDTWLGRSYYDMLNKIAPEISNHNVGDQINTKELPLVKILIVMSHNFHRGTYRWCDIFTLSTPHYRQKLQQIQKDISIHDICNIQFTSGTTGHSKGAALTHNNLVNNAYFIGKRMLLIDKHHKICLQVPFFHTFGTVLGIFVAANYGATLVLPSPKFSPTKSLEAVIEEKCTVLYGTPTMYIDLITIVNKMAITDPAVFSKLSSLEVAVTAGAICPPELFRKMKKIFNFKRIYSGYGMTEVSPIAFFSSPTDSEYLVTSTIGNVLDHSEVKVIDDNGRIVPFGTPGEVCFKGYNVMKGYYNDPQANEKAFLEEGWIRSGDRFVLLDNGYGQVVGRIKDTIIRGGENIEPSEIENVIITHPQVSNVQVYAVSDERLGEVVAASIMRNENSSLTEAEVRAFCEGKFASYKIPKYIVFVEDFPRTASGKIQKFRLRENLERELGLKSH